MRFTIKARLTGVVGFLSLLTVLIGLLGLYGIGKANDGLKTVYENRTVALEQVTKIESSLYQNQVILASMLQNPNPEKIKSDAAAIEKRITDINDLWHIYSSSDLSQRRSSLLTSLISTDPGSTRKDCCPPLLRCATDARMRLP